LFLLFQTTFFAASYIQVLWAMVIYEIGMYFVKRLRKGNEKSTKKSFVSSDTTAFYSTRNIIIYYRTLLILLLLKRDIIYWAFRKILIDILLFALKINHSNTVITYGLQSHSYLVELMVRCILHIKVMFLSILNSSFIIV